jgi:dTDP-4-dehydrorhamnose reductase
MKKIAIIGANGQLGSDIYICLKEIYNVIPLLHDDIEITQWDSVDSGLNKIHPDIIINTAVYPDLNKCENYPGKAFLVNGIGTRNLSIWCKENDCILVHISTDYVFDGQKNKPYTEEDCTRPLNTYGITKLAGEFYISSILEKYIIIRTAGLYGKHPCRGKRSKNFVDMFLELIENKERVEFGGEEICTLTFTENLAEQIKRIIETNEPGIFHATSEGFCSWFEFGEEIIKQTNSTTKLVKRGRKESVSNIIRPKYTVLENKHLNDFGINIMPGWKEALNEYLEKFMSNATIESNPKITILLLNYNGWEDTIECLESVYKITYPNWEVILVENGSEDDSVSRIKEWAAGKIQVESKFFDYDAERKPIEYIEELFYDEEEKGVKVLKKEEEWDALPPYQKLSILRIEKNRGPAGGNNIGIEYILREKKTDYILLLNNDTVVDKEFLWELVKVGERDEKIAAVQPAIYYYYDQNRIQSIGGKLNLLTGREYDITDADETATNCDRLNGAAMLVRTSIIKKIGLFDNQYFLYMDETDWCYRAKRRGYYLVGCSKSKVWHKFYSSSGGEVSPTLVYYWTRNFILFYRKNCKYYLPSFLLFFTINLIIQLGVRILKRQPELIKGIIYGFIDGIMGKKGMLTRHL